MMMKITTVVLMTMMNASSPDPIGHSHTDLCFTLLNYSQPSWVGSVGSLSLAAGFTTFWLSGLSSFFSLPRPEPRYRARTPAECVCRRLSRKQHCWGLLG